MADRKKRRSAPDSPARPGPEGVSPADRGASLQRRAEAAIGAWESEDRNDPPSAEDARRLLHELRVHQVGLEMQNEELRRTHKALEAVLTPEGDIGELALADVLDVAVVQALMDDFYALTRIGVGILDLDGRVLVATGWQDICTGFHRAHPEACQSCHESDLELSRGIEPGTFKLYRCKNSMWDMATPIAVGERHLGNLFLGQFLFDDEKPDLEVFRAQARRFGFDEAEYLAALERVPRWSRETVDAAMKFYASLAGMLAAQSWAGIELGRSVAERERLIESLQRSEARYRDLVENLNDVVYAVNPDGELTYVSPSVTAMLGYSPEELVGTSHTALVHPDDLARVRAAFREVIDGELKPREYRMMANSGRVHWVRTSSRPVVRDGVVVGLQGVLTDITEARRVRDEFARSERRFRETIENVDLIAVGLDAEGRVAFLNDHAHRLLGWNRDEALGKDWFETFVPGGPREEASAVFRSTLERGELPLHFDNPVLTRDGEERIVHWSNTVLRDAEGRAVGTFSLGEDRTEGLAAEAEARRSRELLEATQKLAGVGGWEHDPATGTIEWTDEVYRIHGLSRDAYDPSGYEVSIAMYASGDRERVREAFGRLVAEGEPYDLELGFVNAQGEHLWVRTMGRAELRDGRVVRTYGNIMDVSERRRGEDSLREALLWQERIFEGSRDAVFISDEDARFTAVNTAAVALTGYPRDELLGMRIPDLHEEPDLHAFAAFHSRILAGESVLSAAPIRRKDGRKVEVEFSNSPIVIGERRFMHTVARDVTERVRAEMAVRESEARYRRLFTTMAEGFALHEIICDAEGQPTDYRFLEANPMFFELTGLEPGILGRTVLEVLPGTEPFWIDTYGRVALSGEPAQFEHYSEAIGKHFEVRAFSPQPGRFATVVLDVSKRKRADEERSRLVEHVRGLAARLAQVEEAQRLQLARELHDRVGQNLTALGLNLTVLRNRLSPESLTEFGPRLDDADRLLCETAEEIRYVMAELRPPVLDAYGLVAALRWFAEVFTQRTGVTAVVTGSELEPRLRGDIEVAIFRIVQEALTNVAKHAQAGSVRIAVDEGPSGPRVAVVDDGIGFVPTARGTGTGREGWGLTIMEERAAAIGGALHVTSSRGEGTRVVLDLGGSGR